MSEHITIADLRKLEAAKGKGKAKKKPKTDYKAIFLQQLVVVGIPTPTQEFIFHPTRKWRFDFCWPDHKVAVEYQGMMWKPKGGENGKSGHQSLTGLIRDCEKMTEASLLGWRIILIHVKSVESGQALQWVEKALGQ